MRGFGLLMTLGVSWALGACGDDGGSADAGTGTDSGAGTGSTATVTSGSGTTTATTGTATGSGSAGGTDSVGTTGTSSTSSGGTSVGTSVGSTGGSSASSSGGSGSSGSTGGSGGTASSGSTGGVGEIMCPGVFPAFDDGCAGDDDCVVVVHTTDCCGNSVALGINAAEQADFDVAEAICDSQYPGCGCPSGPTVADDGCNAWDPNDLGATCDNGSCKSFVMGGC